MSTRHGHARHGNTSPEYNSWHSMMYRIRNPKHISYHRYGGRGITVCDGLRSFVHFLKVLGPRLGTGYSLDRFPDRNGNYSCGECEECVRMGWKLNCRWATRQEQQNNTAFNHFLTARGRTQTVSQWARETGVSRTVVYQRINNYGWSVEDAIFTPIKKREGPPNEKVFPLSAVYTEVRAGRMKPASAFPCDQCGQQAKFYHHFLGTERQHWLDVLPLCRSCHWRATRGKAKRQGV